MTVAAGALSLVEWAGVVSALVAIIGVPVLFVQLRQTSAASRVQATIQFQDAFQRSQQARGRVQASFPVHESLLERLVAPERRGEFRSWKTLEDLTEEEIGDARAVVGAMNDVAQYVVDGMPLRSALQQYHTIFVRIGALLLPYLEQENAAVEGRPQARFGWRVVGLHNAGISYHLDHPKHRGRQLVLKRSAFSALPPVPGEQKKAKLVLLDTDGRGVEKHPGFGDDGSKAWSPVGVYRHWVPRRAAKRAERHLRG